MCDYVCLGSMTMLDVWYMYVIAVTHATHVKRNACARKARRTTVSK